MLRIAYVGLSVNGAIRDNYCLVGRHLANRCCLHALTGTDMSREMIPEVSSFMSLVFDRKKPLTFLNIFNYIRMIVFISKAKADVIFFNTPHPVNIYISLIFFFKKQVVYLHDPLPHSGMRLLDRISYEIEKRILFLTCSRFIVSSNAMKKLMPKSKQNSTEVVYLGTIENLALDKFRDGEQDVDVLFFGRIEAYKGLDVLKNAMLMLEKRGISCVVAGKGDIGKVFPGILPLPANITRIDEYLEDEKLAELISKSRMVVLPYRDATGTMAIQAAFYYGKPVIATDAGGLSEYIVHDRQGIIIPVNDPTALAKAILELMENEEKRKQLGHKGKERLDECFDNEKLALQYMDILNDLCKGRRILQIAEAPGGVRKHVMDVVSGMSGRGWDVHLIYGERFKTGFLPDDDRYYFNRHLVRELKPIKDLRAFIRIVGTIRKLRPRIVHTHSSKAGFLGRIAARICGVKKIYYTPHAYYIQDPGLGRFKKALINFAEKILSRFFTTMTINVSDGEKAFAIKSGIDDGTRLKVIYNGISDAKADPLKTSEIKRSLGIKDDNFVVGTLSRFDPQKDPMTFYKIAKKVIQITDRVVFVFAGEGGHREMITGMIRENMPPGRFIAPGFVEDAGALAACFDIYLSTSLYEGLPYAPIEALRAGIPLCVTDTQGNNEVVEDGVNGYLFETGNADEGASKLMELIRSEKLQEMGRSSRDIFEKNYLLDDMLNKLDKYIYR